MHSIIALWTSFVMLFISFVPGFVAPEKKAEPDKSYPYVFVHGFLGWGEDEGINEDLAYWGATSCNLIGNLKDEGYTCYDASVGPLSSNWDRACELYAQLVGGTVDYGAAHSEKCNHKQFGRTYTTALIKDWGKTDDNGLVNKVNLIGHSFGGNTIRLLAELLQNGSQEEIAQSNGGEISGLFTGGKSDYINALVTVCSPNNGTTLAYISEELHLTQMLVTLSYLYAGIMGRSIINGYVDFHLEQFGLTKVPNTDSKDIMLHEALKVVIDQKYDSVVYDLSPDGVQELNDKVGINDNIYYFSYAFSTTVKDKLLGNYVPIPSTLGILMPFATMMGAYPENTVTDYKFDETWLENDGLVNVKSALYPLDDPHIDYNPDSIETGIWNVMPISKGDHGSAIGIGVSEEATMAYYNGMIDMIESLPVIG